MVYSNQDKYKHIMKKLYLMAICLLTALGITAQTIQLEDIVNGKYREKQIRGIRPMSDGETYLQISQDGKKIMRCSFKNGGTVQTLFDIDKARGPKLGSFSGYIMSPDEANILIETNRKPIYRRSYTADYYIYNIRNNTLVELSKNGPQECPQFSPDGTMIAFVRDNNIFLVKLLFNNSESQITKDGERNKIINGKPDWV